MVDLASTAASPRQVSTSANIDIVYSLYTARYCLTVCDKSLLKGVHGFQVEALSALKRYQEAAEALDVLAKQDHSFTKSKDYKLLLKQVQAIS